MQVLRRGSQGADVRRFQTFLIGQGHYSGKADGDFGPATEKAVIAFQIRHGLPADGVVGNRTVGQAAVLGFVVTKDPDTGRISASWPPKPANLKPLVGTAGRQALFGKFRYRSAPVSGNPENIVILGDWEEKNIVRCSLPQLVGVKGAPASGQIRFHRLAVPQLQRMFSEWEEAGLLDRVLEWSGSYVPRYIRGSRTTLSNHAFGTAFDINVPWNGLGARPALVGQKGCVRELVEIANRCGFYWGGHFTRLDGMHFEVARVIE